MSAQFNNDWYLTETNNSLKVMEPTQIPFEECVCLVPISNAHEHTLIFQPTLSRVVGSMGAVLLIRYSSCSQGLYNQAGRSYLDNNKYLLCLVPGIALFKTVAAVFLLEYFQVNLTKCPL